MRLQFHHICIETNSYEDSIDFYVSMLGFKVIHETRNFHDRDYNTWLQNGNVIIELQTPKMENNKVKDSKHGSIGLMHVCFKVDSVDDVITELDRKGFTGFIDTKKKYMVMDSNLSKIRAPEGTIIELRE